MTDDTKLHYKRIRKELCEMLGYGADPDALPIDQDMRLDTVFGLKLSLDEMRARLFRGEGIDHTKMLNVSEALEKYLPKQPEPKPSVDDGDDPRENLIRIVEGWIAADEAERAEKAAERRAQGLSEPMPDLESAQARIDALEAENARLRGEDPKALPSPDAKVITPRDSDIIEPSETYAGFRPGRDDPPKRGTAVIAGKANPPGPTAAEREAKRQAINNDRSAYTQQGLRPAGGEPWRPFVGGGGDSFFWGGSTGKRAW